MTPDSDFSISFAAYLVEEVVLRAIAGHAEEQALRRARDPLYRLPPEDREPAFNRLHRDWFFRFGLDRPFRTALAELLALGEACARCVVGRALSRQDEIVDLLVAPEENTRSGRSVLVRVRATTLEDAPRLLGWLRAELLKVADMLDPAFGYQPTLPSGRDPAHERVARERYRVIWDASVAGRLARRGVAAGDAVADARRAFTAAFPMLGPAVDESFQRFFDGEIRTHAEWAAFAAAPCGEEEGVSLLPGGRCTLCRFPTYSPEPEPRSLPPSVITRIVSDFPNWRPAAGLCRQCADLYRAELLSRQALAELPCTATSPAG
jgi:hypothetical protein